MRSSKRWFSLALFCLICNSLQAVSIETICPSKRTARKALNAEEVWLLAKPIVAQWYQDAKLAQLRCFTNSGGMASDGRCTEWAVRFGSHQKNASLDISVEDGWLTCSERDDGDMPGADLSINETFVLDTKKIMETAVGAMTGVQPQQCKFEFILAAASPGSLSAGNSPHQEAKSQTTASPEWIVHCFREAGEMPSVFIDGRTGNLLQVLK